MASSATPYSPLTSPILEYFILSGHETPSISLNTTNSTPLLLTITSPTPNTLALSKLLITHFPQTISLPNNRGQTPLMLASKHGLLPLLPLLLTHPTHAADPNTPDHEGNTALHYASAAGELKALRVLLSHGADPGIRNVYQWPPVAYSATVAAEQYFATLIKEVEQRRMDAVMAQQQQVRKERERERQGKRVGAVRLVTERDEGGSHSDRGGGGGVRSADGSGPGYVDWSPVEECRRAMTPTAGRSEWSGSLEGRARAWSGE
ncbi:Target of rapamycin complex 2 subunit avo2 [Coniosporium apollinis]|uniref:Target of rapamycin complex 2 subunit avo2 n=1 Tax=Coniosporium apollinis TaxID=61459 RepID=A0ABQ9NZY7_9PEZI|nr:Target of rapamycin complex 2 subunit avo2 [Coniosporium apollinis]